MLISRRPPFIFCALNKTGSTSIQAALGSYNSRVRLLRLRARYRRLEEPTVFKHARALAIRRLVGEKTWDKSFTFCFVRNPFDRLVSVYHYQKQVIPGTHPLAGKLGFEDWVLAGGEGSAMRLMSEFISDEDGTQMVDFVGRFENLREDFARVRDRLAIQAELSQFNVSQHEHYSQYYTDAARAEVEMRLGADLERFDYSFETA